MSALQRVAPAQLGREPVRVALLVVAGLVLLAAPELFSAGTVRTLMLAALLGMVALGLNLSLGYSGQLALGHVFFYGAAAYTAGILAVEGTTSVPLLLAAGVGVALVAALITGVPGLRLSHWALAITSFFLIELLPPLVELDADLTGGLAGLVGVPRPSLGGGPLTTEDLYRLTIGVLIVCVAVQRLLVHSGYGRILAVLRHDEIQLQSVGVSPYRLKLMMYMLSAVPAGLAGVLFATLDGLVTPGAFSFDTVILVLAGVVLGGQRTLYGPLLGMLVLVIAQQNLLGLEEYALLGYGAFLVLAAVLLPRGIVGTLGEHVTMGRKPLLRERRDDARDEGPVALGPEQPLDLRAAGVSKSFGGNRVLDQVDLNVRSGRVTALIGPNGSGKTTMLNAISGFIRPDSGTVALGDADLLDTSAVGVSRIGVGRTFQTPSLPPDLTLREAVAVASFSRRRARLLGAILRSPRWRRDETAVAVRVDEVLGDLGLRDYADVPASELPLGTKRLAEIARAVMLRPALLILDEPASGLSPDAIELLAALLRRLADEQTAVLLVEHNMDLVLGLADDVYVLASGSVLMTGSPKQVAADASVREVYLGHADEPEAALS